jgi:hypothetical protein
VPAHLGPVGTGLRQEPSWARVVAEHRFETYEGTEEECESGAVGHNLRARDFRLSPGEESPFVAAEFTSSVGTPWETYRRDRSGMSAFAPEGRGLNIHHAGNSPVGLA